MFTKHQAPPAPVSLTEQFAAVEAARAARQRTPYLSHPLAMCYVALTVLIMAYSSLFTVFPILIYFAMWLGLLPFKGIGILRPTRDMAWAMAIPLLCFLSTLWSDYPATSLYLGTAFLVMMLCLVIISRTVRFQSLIEGLIIGISLTLLITLANGHSEVDFMSGSTALVGYLGSKNTVGFIAELGLLAGGILLVSSGGRWRKILLCAPSLLISAICLYLSHSGTAILSFALAAIIMVGVAMLMRLPAQLRLLALGASLLVMVAIIGAGFTAGGQTMVLKALGKEATLTGRTYLWSEGTNIGLERPVLGHGYSAFWVQGQPKAERYWSEFMITARAGFHFHSTYVQVFVDLGGVGLALITLLLVANFLSACSMAARHGTRAEPLLLLGLASMFLIRSFVEVEALGPFGMGVLTFYSVGLRLGQLRRGMAS